MSDTLKKIRSARMKKRKDGDISLPSLAFLAMLVAECEMIGKNDGNRPVTEDEVIRHVIKVQKSVKENIALVEDLNYLWILGMENSFLEGLLEDLRVSEDELKDFIQELDVTNIGAAMKEVKAKFGGSVDMKLASELVKKSLGV